MWFQVADYAEAKKCRERQHTGSCGCENRQGSNPCDYHEAAKQSATDLALGGTPDMSVEEVSQWLNRYHCLDSRRNGGCFHPACQKVRDMLDWIYRTQRNAA